MVLHVLKSDPALRELEHVKVDGPGLAYLFFFNRHWCHGLTKEAALSICSHLADVFPGMDGEVCALRSGSLTVRRGTSSCNSSSR